MPNGDFLICAIMAMLYTHSITNHMAIIIIVHTNHMQIACTTYTQRQNKRIHDPAFKRIHDPALECD